MRTCNCNPDRDPSDLQCGRAQSRDGVDSNFVCKRARYHEWMRRITINPVVKIVKCTDALMWYAGRIGEMVTISGVDDNSLWSRASGFANIIRFTDVEWVEVKTPAKIINDSKIKGNHAEAILLDTDIIGKRANAKKAVDEAHDTAVDTIRRRCSHTLGKPETMPLTITMEGERIKELEAEIEQLYKMCAEQAATILEFQEKMGRIDSLAKSIQGWAK